MPVIDESQARRATQVNQENNASYTQAFRNQRQDIGLSEILTEIQRIADLPLNEATTLPKEAFTSDAFFAWECEELFHKGWM